MDLLSEHLFLGGSASAGGLLFRNQTAHVGIGTAVIPAVTANGQGSQTVTTPGGGYRRRPSSIKSPRARKRQLGQGAAIIPPCVAVGNGEHRVIIRGSGGTAFIANGRGTGNHRRTLAGSGVGSLGVSAVGSGQGSESELELLLLACAAW